MNLSNIALYALAFFGSLITSLILTPAARSAAVVLNIFDHPISSVKTHKQPVPYLGGAAIFLSFVFSLLWIRVLTSFPSGTLRALRGILIGSAIVFTLGLVDDVRHHGLHYRTKFLFQIGAAMLVAAFGIRIKFIQPPWLAYLLTIIWIVGLTNAFNLIDIMDGLAASIAVVAAAAFLFISLPTEEIYVNFAAAALCGAALGFVPYNVSTSWRLFMGDSGSLLLGFICSSLALGTSYGERTEWGVFAPILILALPIFDTFLVFYLRLRRGMSPFLGSKDHFALRMEMLGWTRPKIVLFAVAFTAVLCLAAYNVTRVGHPALIATYACVAVLLAVFTRYILRARPHG